jgi:hypothetical protein
VSSVAQVSNLLYRRLPVGPPSQVVAPADWKSAIQQVGTLRYEASRASRRRRREMMSQPESSLQAELEARLRFETLLADLSSKFINLPANRLDTEIDDAQRRVCECLGVDAAVLWQWSEEAAGVFRLTHYYLSLGGPPVPERMNAEEHFPWFMNQALAGKVVALSSIDQMPAEAARDREVFRHFGVKTTLNIPLSTGGGPVVGCCPSMTCSGSGRGRSRLRHTFSKALRRRNCSLPSRRPCWAAVT